MADYNYRNMYLNIVQLLDMLNVQKTDRREQPLNGVYRMHLLYDEVEKLRKENERLRALNAALTEAEQLAQKTGTAVIVVKSILGEGESNAE